MLRNEMAQLKLPKGFDSTGETRRKVSAPAYFTSPSSSSKAAKKEVVIVKGKGEKLSDIPYVAEQINSRKSTDKALSTLHHLAFGVPPKHLTVKKNLREFSGVVYGDGNDRARLEARIESRAVPLLRQLCDILGVHHAGSRAEMVKNIADFLEKPVSTDAKPKKTTKATKSTTKKSDKSEKKSTKSSKKSEKKSTKSSKKSGKKDKKEGPKRPVSAYLLFCKAKRAEVVASNKDISNPDVTKKLAEMWKKADAATKKPFEEEALADKKRYEAECEKSK